VAKDLGDSIAPRSEPAASSEDLIDRASVLDYKFRSDSSYLRDVTLRTALIDGRPHGRLIGTHTKWCEYSDDEAGDYTERHVIDVSTDYIDLEKVTDLPHRVYRCGAEHSPGSPRPCEGY
jgi:hypothetical protein